MAEICLWIRIQRLKMCIALDLQSFLGSLYKFAQC